MNEKESRAGRFGRLPLRIFLVALGLLAIALAVAWWRLPGWLEEYATEEARKAGFREVSLRVEHIDPWTTTISGIRLLDDRTELSLARLEASFEPVQLWNGVAREVELSGLRLEVDLKAWLDESATPDELGQSGQETIEGRIRSFLKEPAVERVRLLDAILVADFDGMGGEARLNANLAAGSSGLWLDLNGSLEETPLSAVANFALEGNASALTTRIWFEDLVPLAEALSLWFEESLPEKVSPLAGSGILNMKARLLGDAFVDPVVEANASDLEFSAFGQTFRLPKLVLSASEQSEGGWSLLADGTMAEANATVQAEGWQAEAFLDANACEILLRADELHVFPPLPQMHLTNLRLPRWRIPYTDPARFPVGESKIIRFEDFSLTDDSFTFNLYEGEVTVAFPAEGNAFGVHLPPTDASLPLQGVTFHNFSFTGVVEPLHEPYLSLPQSLSADSILLGEDSLLENLVMSFRLASMNKLFVDSLALSLDEIVYELNPAKLIINILVDDGFSLDLNGSTFLLPDLEVEVEGVRGGIRLASVDPLATAGPQELHFDTIRWGDLTITDGHLLFSLDNNDTFAIHDGEAKLFGGILAFEPSSFNLSGDEMLFEFGLRNLDGARIIALFDAFDGEVEGTFSGRIPLRIQGERIDLAGGYLEMNPNSHGRLRYHQSDGLLTEGMKPRGARYKLHRDTEIALKDLKVEHLRLDFLEEDLPHPILGQIKGFRQVDKKTKINLDYRPHIRPGPWELLQHALAIQSEK